MTHQQEGVIKFQLDFRSAAPVSSDVIIELEHWRNQLLARGMIGQDDSRYDGYGFGNLSRRWPIVSDSFLITGSQTGNLPTLEPKYYALVNHFDIANNSVVAEGQTPPSSEALTHGLIYHFCPDVRFVMHVHCPEIWQNSKQLNLPMTPKGIMYGTPEMAEAVFDLLLQLPDSHAVFGMAGHEDGLVSYGETIDQAGEPLLALLARVGP